MADYSEGDVQSLAQKLGEFKETLTPGEQAALTAVVQRAMPQGEDVAGFSVTGPFGGQNVGAVGVQTGDPLGSVFNIFGIPSQKGRDRPGERR